MLQFPIVALSVGLSAFGVRLVSLVEGMSLWQTDDRVNGTSNKLLPVKVFVSFFFGLPQVNSSFLSPGSLGQLPCLPTSFNDVYK